MKKSQEERWIARVNVNGPSILEDPCFEWLGAFCGNGYPIFRLDSGKRVSANKIGYELFISKRSTHGLIFRHKCRNKRCVNPEHLFLTSKFDVLKGRTGKSSDD